MKMRALVYGAVAACALYLCSKIVWYALWMLLCIVLLIMGALLVVHVDGHLERAHMMSLSKPQRRLEYAKKLYLFSICPTKERIKDPHQFGEWSEDKWKGVAKELHHDIRLRRMYLHEVEGYVVHSGLPSREEVERANNTVVINLRGHWSGLFARLSPTLNTALNRYLKCWNRDVGWMVSRLSSYNLPYPAICVDLPTADVAGLNFGQRDDGLILEYVYDLVHRTYPKAKIVIVSVCLGGLRVLNHISRYPNLPNLSAVIIESPLPSVRHLLSGMLGYDSEDLYRTFCLIVPGFRPELECQYSFFRPLLRNESPCNIPIFLGMLESDPFSNSSHLPLFKPRFTNVTVFTTTETKHAGKTVGHGQLFRLPSYQTAVSQFLGLPKRVGGIIGVPPMLSPLPEAPSVTKSSAKA
jgi:hypothetical protein